MIDRMLPGIDGIVIIRCLRENGVTTPALIISALGEVDDRVRGLPSRHTAADARSAFESGKIEIDCRGDRQFGPCQAVRNMITANASVIRTHHKTCAAPVAHLRLSWNQGDPLQLQMRVRHHSERRSTPRSERHVRWRSPPPQWASRSSWRAWPSAARRFLVTIQFRCPNLMCWTSTPRRDEPLVRPNGWTS
jgi:CheY-like chemotaxis protein